MADETNIEKIKRGAIDVGAQLGIDPKDILTAVSYETGGTFDPWKAGPVTQYGQHRGLIQWGEPQRKQYGVDETTDPYDQMLAVGHYLKDRGVESGMGLLDVYSAINAGRVGLYNASDAGNGGAPGTVRDKVESQMADDAQKAAEVLGGDYVPATYMADSRSQGPDDRAPSPPSWLDTAAPNPWFAPEVDNSPEPTWTDVGGYTLRSLPTMQGSQFIANGTVRPDMAWLNDHSTTKFGQLLDDLNPDERSWLIQNAMSSDSARALRDQLDTRKRDANTYAHSNVAAVGSFVAGIFDPATMAAGGLAGKGAALGLSALRATTATTALTRMVEGGFAAAGATGMSASISAGVNPNYNADDFKWELAQGFVFGTMLGGAFGRRNFDEDTLARVSAIAGAKARGALADIAEKRGYVLTDAGKDFLRGPERSIGAAQVPARDLAFRNNRGLVERGADAVGRWFSPEDLLKNRSGSAMANIFSRLMPDLSGTGGRELAAGEDAWSYLQSALSSTRNTVKLSHDQAFAEFRHEMGTEGAALLPSMDLRRTFNELVSDAIVQPDTVSSPAVAKAADGYRAIFRKALNDAKAAGAKWAQDVPEDDLYLPFMVHKGNYNRVVSRIGRDGLTNVIKQLLDDQGGSFIVTKMVNKMAGRDARKAGRAATTMTRDPNTPEAAATNAKLGEIRETARADKALGIDGARQDAEAQMAGARKDRDAAISNVRDEARGYIQEGEVSAKRDQAAALREEVRGDRAVAAEHARTIVASAQKDSDAMMAQVRILLSKVQDEVTDGRRVGRVSTQAERIEKRAEVARLEAQAADLLEQADELENLGMSEGAHIDPAKLREQADDILAEAYSERVLELLPDTAVSRRELLDRVAMRREMADAMRDRADDLRTEPGIAPGADADALRQRIRKRLDEAHEEAKALRERAYSDASEQKLADAASLAAQASDLAAMTRWAAARVIRKLKDAADNEIADIRDQRAKAIREVIDDANEAKTEAIRQLYEEAFTSEFERVAPGYKDRVLQRLAEKYLTTLEDSNIYKTSAARSAVFAGQSDEATRAALTAAGMDAPTIDLLLETLGSPHKSGPANFRRRAPLNREKSVIPERYQNEPNAHEYATALRDIAEKDIEDIWEKYSRDIYGHVALLRQGFQSEADVRNQIDSAARFQELVHKTPEGKQSVYASDLSKAAREMHFYVDKILGKPTSNSSETTRLAATILKNLNFIRYMQQSGIAQLGDMPKIILNYGMKAAWKQFRISDVVNVFRKGDAFTGAAMLRDVQMAVGIGVKTRSGRMHARFEDLDEDVFAETLTRRVLLRAERVTSKLADVTSNVALVNPMTDALQLWAARSASQVLLDHATGRKTLSVKALNDMGVTSDLLDDVRMVAKHMKIDKDGVIVRFNTAEQRAMSRANADAFDRYMGIVGKEARRAILDPAPSGMWSGYQGPIGGLFFQFKSYMLNSLQANTLHNVKLGFGHAAWSLLWTSAWSSVLYSAQQYAMSFGSPDRQKFLDQRLGLGAILSAGFQRSPDSSILPMLIDTAISGYDQAYSGEDHRLFSNTRNSGLGSSLADSIPVVKFWTDFGKAVSNTAAAGLRSDQTFDQRDASGLRDFIPLARTLGILNATNWLITTALPKHTDGPIVRKQKQ